MRAAHQEPGFKEAFVEAFDAAAAAGHDDLLHDMLRRLSQIIATPTTTKEDGDEREGAA